ncbi:MAG TPA: hypothetical protein VN370_01355, partial [Desulfitobacteriaceae bacterium]|nr:hypothetical protein [Desulfitobacteriaceae bacterium]
AFADDVAMPTGSTPISIPEVTSITIRGEDQDIEDAVEAVFEQDNNGPTKFIRADLDTEYDLQSAEIVINLVSAGTTVSSNTLTFSGGGTTTRTAGDVNLLNEKYNVTIGSNTYILAADTPNGIISVSDSDPLKVADVTFTTDPSVTTTIYGRAWKRFAGNPWYAQEGLNWVEVNYNVRADSQLPSGTSRSAVPGTMSLATGASAGGCYSGGYFNLDQNLNFMWVSNGGEGRDYQVSAGVEGQVVVHYNIVLDEIEGSQYYTGDVIDQCQEINAAVAEYFDPEGFYVDSGTTVTDILLDFIDWAERNNYFNYNTETSGGVYLYMLDGLAAFDGGALSGWMYTDEGYSPTCNALSSFPERSFPGVSAADYMLTTDDTAIDWFYTTDFTEHYSGSGGGEGSYDVPVNHTEHDNSTSYNYGGGWNDIYGASSIGYMGAEWSSARYAWCFNYRFAGTGSSRLRSSGNPSNKIRIAAMEIEGTYNTSNLALWTSSDSKYIGSTPDSGSNPDYTDVATAVAGFAITAINNSGASYAWSVAGFIAALRSIADDTETQDDYLWREWDWSSDISDTGQFFYFLADVEPNQTVQISYDYYIFGPGYELLNTGKGYRNLIAPGPDSKSAVANWNPGMMSNEEKTRYGIEEIPLQKVEEKAAELNIPLEIVGNFYKSGEKVLYYAHNLVEYEVEPPASTHDTNAPVSKEALIEEINTQMDRNELIIKAFSNVESMNEEDLAIIQKNKAEQVLLINLLNRVQSINEDDSKAIESLWKELWDDILKEALPSQYEK